MRQRPHLPHQFVSNLPTKTLVLNARLIASIWSRSSRPAVDQIIW
jgi:hypothetical protein